MTDKDDVILRDAIEADLDQVLDLWAEMIDLHHDLDERFWQRKPDGKSIFRNWLAETVDDEERMFFVAESSGRIVGFINGHTRDTPPPLVDKTTGAVDNLTVASEFRGKGIGRRLMTAAMEWFASHGAKSVKLSSALRNEGALGFYEALGFERHTVSMWKSLE